MKFILFFLRLLLSTGLSGVIFLLSTALNGAEVDGYWKFTEESIQKITSFSLSSAKESQGQDASTAEEISESYRNHVRELKLGDNDTITMRLIQFGQADDRYPEYIRKFDLDFKDTGEGAFTISKGGEAVFTGRVSGSTLRLQDARTGNDLELRKISKSEIPYLTEPIFSQGELDRQPKARKLTTPVYPPHLQDSGITGQVEIEFMVNPDGTTSEIQVISSPHEDFSKAAIEAIRTSTFRPGQVNRKPVRTHVKIPITFR